jgi:hypothetical protein
MAAVAGAVSLVILVEGPSDVASLRALTTARGLDHGSHGFELVSMGGVTNARHHLTRLARETPGTMVAGLYDAAEERFVVRALRDHGFAVESRDDVERHGFFVCDRDLEEEIIRALGPESVEGVLAELRLIDRFRTFQRQPEWRGRPVAEQLRRFAGVASGRKTLLAGELTGRLTPANTPRPLAALVDLIEARRAD